MANISEIPTKKENSVYLYFLFSVCFSGGLFGGISSTLMPAYLPVVVKELVAGATAEKTEQVSAVINSIFLFGMMFGGILLGFFGDRFGRKLSLQCSLAFLGLFTALTALASNWSLVMMCRFFSGFGTGGVLVATTILVAEEWTEKNRRVALGILSICFPVGIFSAGFITYHISNWRSGFLSGIIPLLIVLITQFTLKESEQWKKSQSSEKTKSDKGNSIFQATIARELIFGCLVYGTMLIGLWAVFAWLPTWVQSLSSSTDGQKERGTSMMLFAVGGLAGGLISGWLSKLLGVKRTLYLCFAATFILCFTLFKLNDGLSLVCYFEMALVAFFFGVSQGALNFYIPELFPTAVRSSATGFCFNVGRTFTASVVFFVGWLVQSLGGYGNALFIFSFIFLFGLIITVFAKEKNLISS